MGGGGVFYRNCHWRHCMNCWGCSSTVKPSHPLRIAEGTPEVDEPLTRAVTKNIHHPAVMYDGLLLLNWNVTTLRSSMMVCSSPVRMSQQTAAKLWGPTWAPAVFHSMKNGQKINPGDKNVLWCAIWRSATLSTVSMYWAQSDSSFHWTYCWVCQQMTILKTA